LQAASASSSEAAISAGVIERIFMALSRVWE
jgi:hypothetical protein